MCFSPAASFAAGAVLAYAGVLTWKKAARPAERVLAAMPLLFSLQQLIEGWLWLTLPNPALAAFHQALALSYAVFVGMVWPVMPALGLYLTEPQRRRRQAMACVLAAGIFVAFYTLVRLAEFPVTAAIGEACIVYHYPVPQPHFMLAVYVLATCGAFFLSSARALLAIGAVNLAAFLVTYYFYRYDLASVWCFFAAVISAMLYGYFERAPAPAARPSLETV